ncbi:hypothetical protein PTKU15_83460 [Paraburkholderia terrae]|nr:hypothetical protein PTKU15_83460 [Paraburkholderia terrae]
MSEAVASFTGSLVFVLFSTCRPNYSANLVDNTGTIGPFGTAAREPASVDISENLACNGPISIRGTVNPLADKPSLDVSASAHYVELRNLTPYSLKYAGYPITSGTLNASMCTTSSRTTY